MNILFVLNFYPAFGGIETVTGNLASYLSRFHTVYTLSYRADSAMKPAPGISACFTFDNQIYEDNVHYFNDLVNKKQIDCVINQGMVPGLTDVIFNSERNDKVKVISVLHRMPGYEKLQYWLQPRIAGSASVAKAGRKLLSVLNLNSGFVRYVAPFRKSYRKSTLEGDKVVLLADGYKEEFLSLYGLESHVDKVCCIANPLSEHYSTLGEPDLDSKQKEVLYVGRISDEKRVHMLLDVWQKVRREGWKLVIVGDGPLRQELQDAGSEFKDIEFAGYHSDPSPFYKRAEILLLSSAYEGFGMCLVEGMAYGVCPVAFNVGAGVCSVLSENGGTAVRNGDMDAMAEVVSELMDNDELRHRQAIASYRKSGQYKIETIGNQWNNLISNLTSN